MQVLEEQEFATELDVKEKRVVKASDLWVEEDEKEDSYKVRLGSFGIESFVAPRSVAQFVSNCSMYLFNDPIQRGSAWDIQRKSELIHTILEDFTIDEILIQYVRRSKKKYLNVIDGKQRLTTIRDYVKGKFPLTPNTSYVDAFDEEGEEILVDVGGLFFKELPKPFRDRILAHIIYFRECEMTDEQKALLFKRKNNGVALTKTEKRKAIMSFDLLSFVAEERKKPVFTAPFGQATVEKESILIETVQQAMIILATDGETGIDGASLDAFVQSDLITEELKEQTAAVSTYLSEALGLLEEKRVKTTFAKTKLTAMFIAGKEAIRLGVPVEDFTEWVEVFFDREYQVRGFSEFTSGSTARSGNVKKRINVMMVDFRKQFAPFYSVAV